MLESYAGLTVNTVKSKIIFSRDCKCEQEVLSILKFSQGNFPLTYLGIPLLAKYLNKLDCNALISKVEKRLEGWVSKLISNAGRIQLVNSILYGIVLFWMQCFNLPVSVIHKLNQLCASFVWRGKTHLISWETVTNPKNEGGLGLRKLTDLQTAVTVKKIWRFLNGESMWANWMSKRYCDNIYTFWYMQTDNNASGVWKSMMKARNIASTMIRKSIRDGETTAMWLEPWTGQKLLVQTLGLSYVASRGNLHDSVACFITDGAWNEQIRRFPTDTAKCIARTKISGSRDHWTWTAGGEKGYTLRTCWNRARVHRPEVDWYNLLWFSGNCPKFSVCAYKVVHRKLLTRDRMVAWGITNDEMCVLCKNVTESHEHLFFQCAYANCVWINLCRNLGLQIQKLQISEVIPQFKAQFHMKNQLYSLARLTLTATLWHLWRERNNRVFRQENADPITCIQKIKGDVRILMAKCQYKTSDVPVFKSILQSWEVQLNPP